jgi:integrase
VRETVRERNQICMGKLSAKFVENIDKNGRYYDGDGLILFVSGSEPPLAKSWVLRYTSPTSTARRDMGLGAFSRVGLAKARLLATKAKGVISGGVDPLAASNRVTRNKPNKLSIHRGSNFETIVKEFHDRHRVTLRNEKYAAQWLRNIERLILRTLGKSQFEHLTASDFLAVVQPIAITTPEQCRRIVIQLDMIFKDALARALISSNPVENLKVLVKYPSVTKANHPAILWVQAPQFVSELAAADISSVVKMAYLFLILTGCRTNEILNARWSEFDDDENLWLIPAERMKAGKSHKVWLSKQARELFKQLKKCNKIGADFVFGGVSGLKPINSNSLLNATKSIGYGGKVSPHGFRATFSTWANDNAISSPDIIESALVLNPT